MKDFYTLKEIEQQKRLWLETINLVKEKISLVRGFFNLDTSTFSYSFKIRITMDYTVNYQINRCV